MGKKSAEPKRGRCAYCGCMTATPRYKAGPYLGYPAAFPHSARSVPAEILPLCELARRGADRLFRIRMGL